MRKARAIAVAFAAFSALGITGCSNWQGTAADPSVTQETITYTNNDDPQNSGSGSGVVVKPPAEPYGLSAGQSPSEAQVRGTDNPPGSAYEGGNTMNGANPPGRSAENPVRGSTGATGSPQPGSPIMAPPRQQPPTNSPASGPMTTPMSQPGEGTPNGSPKIPNPPVR